MTGLEQRIADLSAQTFTYADRSRWTGDGYWQDEPDKAQWLDEATGLYCLAVRGGSGAWCGYVGVPLDHRWYGVAYGGCDDGAPGSVCEVHGGLTFSGHGIKHANQPERGIVLVGTDAPQQWWLGFDCNHYRDCSPSESFGDYDAVYRQLGYVLDEVISLAAQVAANRG